MKDIKEITQKLEEGIQKVFTSTEYIKYLNVMSKFHHYSFGNCMLILSQKPDASLVAGYKSWQKNFKRQVKRGEKGITILAPMPRSYKVVNEETGEEEEHKYTAYHAVTVFDISQTDGEELPKYGAKELVGDVKQYRAFIKALKGVAKVPVHIKEIDGEERGYCAKNEIVIKKGMSELQTIKTLIHEVAHNLLGHVGSTESRTTCEVEAESVAYVVSQYFGLDTSEYSFPYIAGWAGESDKKVIQRVLGNIQKTADCIIKGCESAVA